MCSSRTENCSDCGQFIMLKYLAFHKESHKLNKFSNGNKTLCSFANVNFTIIIILFTVAKPVLDDSPESLAAYPPLIKKVSNIEVGGTARATTRTISMPTMRIHEPIMTNHRVSPPVKRNNDQPQINTLNNNDNTHKDPKKNMPIVDTPSGNNYFNFIFFS